MKKLIVFILLLSLFVFFQSTNIYAKLTVRSVSPDFVFILFCLAAFLLGPIRGQIIGFIVGFMIDILSGGMLGLSSFTLTLLGYIIGFAGLEVYGNSALISVILLFLATIARALIFGLLAAIFLKPGYFGFFTQGRVFLEAILNSILSPLFFVLITRIERRISE